MSFQYDGYWTDIGTIGSFFEANLKLTENNPEFNLFNSSNSILTRPRVLPPTQFSGTTINNVLLAEGGKIKAKSIESSVIGIRSIIGEGTVIKTATSWVVANTKLKRAFKKHRKQNSIKRNWKQLHS